MSLKPAWKPDNPLPVNADKVTGAAIITHLFFPVSPRTLEKWPLTVRRPNKAAIYEVAKLLEIAKAKYDASHPYKQAADY